MKIITQKPTLTLTTEELDALTKARNILDELTEEDSETLADLLEDTGTEYYDLASAYEAIDSVINVAITKEEAKNLCISLTQEIIVSCS